MARPGLSASAARSPESLGFQTSTQKKPHNLWLIKFQYTTVLLHLTFGDGDDEEEEQEDADGFKYVIRPMSIRVFDYCCKRHCE